MSDVVPRLVGLKAEECVARAELAGMPADQYAELWNRLAPCINATRLSYDIADETAEMLLDRLVGRVWNVLTERIYQPIKDMNAWLAKMTEIAESKAASRSSAPSERELDLEKKLYAALEALKTIEAMRPRAMGHTAQSIARRVLSAYGGPPADSNVLERVESREGVAPGLGADAGKDQGGGDNALRSTAGAERAAAGADTPSPLPEAASDAAAEKSADTWLCDTCGRQVDVLYAWCDVCSPELNHEQRCPTCKGTGGGPLGADTCGPCSGEGFIDTSAPDVEDACACGDSTRRAVFVHNRERCWTAPLDTVKDEVREQALSRGSATYAGPGTVTADGSFYARHPHGPPREEKDGHGWADTTHGGLMCWYCGDASLEEKPCPNKTAEAWVSQPYPDGKEN